MESSHHYEKHRISDLGEARSLKPVEVSVFHERSAEQLFYTAPEMAKGLKYCRRSVDVYSFAIIAAEVMYGCLFWREKQDATGYGLFCLSCLLFVFVSPVFFSGKMQSLLMLFKKDFALVWMGVKKTSWKSFKNAGKETHLPGLVCQCQSSAFYVFS